MSPISAIIIQQTLHRPEKSTALKHNRSAPNFPQIALLYAVSYALSVNPNSPSSPPTLCSSQHRLQLPPASQHPIPSNTASPQRSIITSPKMANHCLSGSDASGNIHHLQPSDQRGFWVCHDCGHLNNNALCPERCGVCPHYRCGSCNKC